MFRSHNIVGSETRPSHQPPAILRTSRPGKMARRNGMLTAAGWVTAGSVVVILIFGTALLL